MAASLRPQTPLLMNLKTSFSEIFIYRIKLLYSVSGLSFRLLEVRNTYNWLHLPLKNGKNMRKFAKNFKILNEKNTDL